MATATRHPGPAADQTNPSPADNDPVHAEANQPPAPAVPGSPGVSDDPGPGQVRYTVKRRDTLWSIADRHLGDPLRYRDIAALNPHLGPDYQIHPGQVLTLPTPQQATPTDPPDEAVQVTVRKGDTLCGIAHEHGIGDWHTVWAANAGKAEPGGKRFTNPDHIEVGWHLTVPVTQPNPHTSAASASSSPTPSPATPGAAPMVGAAPAPESRHGPQAHERPATAADDPSARGRGHQPRPLAHRACSGAGCDRVLHREWLSAGEQPRCW